MIKEFDLTSGCAGVALSTKQPILEPFAQSSTLTTKQEINVTNIIVSNVIAVPIFDEHKNSIGVFEAFNSIKSAFTTNTTKELLMKFSRCISLLLYTNGLLKVMYNNYV